MTINLVLAQHAVAALTIRALQTHARTRSVVDDNASAQGWSTYRAGGRATHVQFVQKQTIVTRGVLWLPA